MEEVHPSVDNQNSSLEIPRYCSQCGWPGTGILPAGVSVVKQNGQAILIGNLSYFHLATTLCSLCQEMESAVARRPWFVRAHAEYLEQVTAKKHL
jgi:hypothetical protein